MDLPDTLEKRVGPFPVAGWLAILAGGVGLALVARRFLPADVPVAPVDGADGAVVTDPQTVGGAPGVPGYNTNPPILGGGYGPPPQPVPGSGTPTSSAPTTNLEWSRLAVTRLIADNFDPTTVTTAIGRFLEGLTLTVAQGAIVSTAIRLVGPPPEFVPPPDVADGTPDPTPHLSADEQFVTDVFVGAGRLNGPDPSGLRYWTARLRTGESRESIRAAIVFQIAQEDHPSTPPPAPGPTPGPGTPGPTPPAPARQYTVRPNDTLSRIAQQFYGDGRQWPRIYAANSGVIGPNPNLLHVGTVLVIPA